MPSLSPEKLAILLGLSFFLGLAFEGFYAKSQVSRPGGIRTFPLISLSGALLYALEPQNAIAFCVGLAVLGIWLYPYYQAQVSRDGRVDVSADGLAADGITVPMCNLVAYMLGPVALYLEPWLAFGLTAAAVLLLQARDRLHALARTVSGQEVITLGQFLILTGIVLPLVPNAPVTTLTPITPFQVWLAVVVVSSLSYGSYPLQRLLSARRSSLVSAMLGGLYSSTATTVVLARRLSEDPESGSRYQSGIVLATALIFAILFVVTSIASAWVLQSFGDVGVYWLAGIVGVTDIDPFVLSLAQGGVGGMSVTAAATAILIAASSNNLLKATYAVVFAGWRQSRAIVVSLVALGVLGFASANWMTIQP